MLDNNIGFYYEVLLLRRILSDDITEQRIDVINVIIS